MLVADEVLPLRLLPLEICLEVPALRVAIHQISGPSQSRRIVTYTDLRISLDCALVPHVLLLIHLLIVPVLIHLVLL